MEDRAKFKCNVQTEVKFNRTFTNQLVHYFITPLMSYVNVEALTNTFSTGHPADNQYSLKDIADLFNHLFRVAIVVDDSRIYNLTFNQGSVLTEMRLNWIRDKSDKTTELNITITKDGDVTISAYAEEGAIPVISKRTKELISLFSN